MKYPYLLAVGLLVGFPQVGLGDEASVRRMFKSLDANKDGQLSVDEVRPEHAALFARLIRTADADDDGQLGRDEFAQGLQPSRPAKPLVEKPSGKLPGADALELLLSRMDRNGDQRLVVEEVPKRYLDFFDRMEERLGGEKDGRIDRRELIQASPKLCQLAKRYAAQNDIDVAAELARLPKQQRFMIERPKLDKGNDVAPEKVKKDVARMLKRFDQDEDGQLSREEVPKRMAERFDRIDVSGDGVLDREELGRVVKLLSRMRNAEKGPSAKSLKK